MITSIKKRDGRTVSYNEEKIAQAIFKAMRASGNLKGEETAHSLAQQSLPSWKTTNSFLPPPRLKKCRIPWNAC